MVRAYRLAIALRYRPLRLTYGVDRDDRFAPESRRDFLSELRQLYDISLSLSGQDLTRPLILRLERSGLAATERPGGRHGF
jgi:hypothetical protein